MHDEGWRAERTLQPADGADDDGTATHHAATLAGLGEVSNALVLGGRHGQAPFLSLVLF